MTAFSFGHASGSSWREAAEACLAALRPVPSAGNLGFLYVGDEFAADMGDVLDRFRSGTGVEQWVGTVGMGVCATGTEYYDEPAVAAMIGEFPAGSFRVFPAVCEDLKGFDGQVGGWIEDRRPYLGLVHADPRNPRTAALVSQLSAVTSSGFLVGGLASSRGDVHLYADGVTSGGVAGVLFAEEVGAVTRLSQGCSPIGPKRSVSEVRRNVIFQLDARPALDVLKEDVGEVLARDLTRIGGFIHAALPIAGSDTGDYLVRELIGIDPRNGLVAIGDMVEQGSEVMFCRRDANAAREDLQRMLRGLAKGLDGPPRGGIYVSCLGRGRNLFGEGSAELKLIEAELGSFPLVGFYASGEISRDRLYGYTGVLTLFP